MIRPRALIGALLLAHAAVAAAQVHEGKTIVTARLVADTVRFQPGKPFTAGLHLTIAPGWHVYWENPGDTALPVAVSWEGAKTSALRWPLPERYQEKGAVTVFGYEDETLLLTTVTPPRSESLALKAKADWLVCETICIPGEAELSLTLPAGEPSPSPDSSLIKRFDARVPRSTARIVNASARQQADRWLITLEVEPRGRITTFFPRTMEGFFIEHGQIEIDGHQIQFPALPDEPTFKPERISGVIVTSEGAYNVASVIPSDSEESPSTGLGMTDWLSRDLTTTASTNTLSIPLLLLFAALGGLLLNVMPCVLPVISLKILSFVHQAGHDPKRTRLNGLMFGAGVIVSFWILVAAVAAVRATAAQIGWGFQFQSPLFVVVMSVIVLVFAMNLFGVFEIAGPSVSGAAASSQGSGGAFFHGVLATVLATPCTAPFLGTAIGFAFTQSLGILFLAFTAAAVGLALPYVVLSCQPAWLRWLPKPGMWMIRFKQAMGFVLLGTVVWLLSVLATQLGPEGVVWSLVFLTIVAFAVWLVGQAPGRVWPKAAAVVLIIGGYFWTLEHELRWRAPVTAEESASIRWEPFSLADVKNRVERGETVFIDFTADWCWSCKVNERTVLATSAVEETMRRLDVTTIKADWTRRNPEITRLLAKFGRAGVPFYVVFPARRLTAPIPLSEIITPASVIEALDRAGPSVVERNP